MGVGDSIMVSGEAKHIYETHGLRTVVVNEGRPVWSDMWKNLPYIMRPEEEVSDKQRIWIHEEKPNGVRPYHSRWEPTRVFYNYDFELKKGELKFDIGELNQAKRRLKDVGLSSADAFVVINPDFKNTTSKSNKNWGLHKYQEVVDELFCKYVHMVQLIPDEEYVDVSGLVKSKEQYLSGGKLLHKIRTKTAREAFAILSFATAVVTAEGGLSHAAGVMNIPGVVIFGGFTPPELTGYDCHTNIYRDHPISPCGTVHIECRHCREVMESIDSREVLQHLFNNFVAK